MPTVAAGATVFKRVQKLESLLDSIDSDSIIETVYIGDNGELTEEKQDIYAQDYPFELEILDLEYDSGLGHSRRAIVEQSNEEYLLIVDNDVEIPHNIESLLRILRERPDIGGVGGVLIEDDRIRSECHDFFERGSLLVRDIREPKQIQNVTGLPVVEFEQIQNVTMYRRECLEDYTWDPNYIIGWEHADFFLAHKKQTDWNFGVCPEVMFRHYPGGSQEYKSKRSDYERNWRSKQYFLEKWNYDQVLNGQTRWLGTEGGLPSDTDHVVGILKNILHRLPASVQAHLMNLRDFSRKVRDKPPF